MLKIYPFIIETLKLLRAQIQEIEKHDGDLARQLRRAASSIALNTQEGVGSHAGNRTLRFRTALGSNQEVRACLDVAEAWGYVDPIDAAFKDRFDFRFSPNSRLRLEHAALTDRRHPLQARHMTIL